MIELQDKAIESLHRLEKICAKKIMIDYSMSWYTQKNILEPMQKMDWAGKYKRSEELIEILCSASSEEEIIRRSAELE